MRIPNLYLYSSWQRLFAGMAIGAVISWVIFLYIFGVFQEKQAKLLHKKEGDIEELKNDIKIWQDGFKELNKKKIEELTVQTINVKIMNWNKHGLDGYSVYEVEEEVKKDISMVVAKDLESVFKNRELLKKAIENKRIRINDKPYRLVVKEMMIYTTLSIQLDIQLE